MVEVHDDGKAVSNSEIDVLDDSCKAVRIDGVVGVVRTVLPADRDTHGVETCSLDDRKVCIADRVSPAAVIAAVGIPGVTKVNTASEDRVHGSAQGVVHGNDCGCGGCRRYCCGTTVACPEGASDRHCRKNFFNHGNPQKGIVLKYLFSKSI